METWPVEPTPAPRVADIWANWWDAGFFAANPPTAALYARLGMNATIDAMLAAAQREQQET